MSSDTGKKTSALRRVLEMGLAFAALVVIIFLVTLTVKVGRGVSRTVDTPDHLVRLQVLNASGTRGVATTLSRKLDKYRDSDIEIQIVDMDNFDMRAVKESFVISREIDEAGAELLAKRLGLDPDRVEYKPLENNYRQVSATLILGEDWTSVRLSQPTSKE